MTVWMRKVRGILFVCFVFFCLFVCFVFMATPAAYGNSQVRSKIRAAA